MELQLIKELDICLQIISKIDKMLDDDLSDFKSCVDGELYQTYRQGSNKILTVLHESRTKVIRLQSEATLRMLAK